MYLPLGQKHKKH